MPHPCIGSSASVFKISKSSVPCNRSVDGGILFPFPRHPTRDLHLTPVECQGGGLLYAKVKHESTTAGVMLVGKANNQEAIQKRASRRSAAMSPKPTSGSE